MFGRYSADSLQKISSKRTEDAEALIKGLGGEVKAGYALLGKDDLVLIVDLPNKEAAMKASVALNRMLGISFTTSPAVTVTEFDQLMAEL
jgi:uncharacterized protein with GYD domain